ncbi:uncharacterized protein B0T15DRAFT_487041 [Chaetomium strumarium]|uniref:C2H2-type domain-containing protein n=1 Tax=Chaetomium strumarium TaxID=1170767 RepID=A0AAJ0GPT9_9PEZI|nr:hypothetical protein B0T15DRAFT_487041 [Chaetomium strumarium]
MVEPSIHTTGTVKATGPVTVTQRGGPRRSSALLKKADSEESDYTVTDDESVTASGAATDVPQLSLSPTAPSRLLKMANPDRPYDMFADGSGRLVRAMGALIPDGYKQDTTIPSRPWICPVRSCRWLFKALHDLGHHFKHKHRGCELNDNLDGTLCVLREKGGRSPPGIISRNPMDSEPIGKPKQPVYRKKTVLWVEAVKGDASEGSLPRKVDHIAPDRDALDVVSDIGLETATDGRLYDHWWAGESGQLVHMAGALIPVGYKLDDTYSDRQWVCPIRSCRLACKSKRSLGYHFQITHKSCTLNDNGDGTFSVVGYSASDIAPRVVSRKPLDPSEGPIPEPQFPVWSAEGCNAARQKRLVVQSPAGPSSADESASVITGSSTAISGDADRLWSYIRSRVGFRLPSSAPSGLELLLRQSKLRDLNLARFTPPSALTPKQYAAMIIQIVGEENPKRCSECRRHPDPLHSCVGLSVDAAKNVYGLLTTSARACANCLFRKRDNQCSLRRYTSLLLTASEDRYAAHAPHDTFEEPGEDIFGRRRSTRLSLVHDDDDADSRGESMADPAPRSRPRRSVLGRRSAAAWKTDPPTEADLHMESWEIADRRINVADEPLAFSSAYLTANQTVQVTSNATFVATTIPSGRVEQFPADSTKTRICTLSSGKLRVQVGSEPEFAIGSQGIFKIDPGVACSVSNRCYLDVVLHITSLSAA